MQEKTTTVYDSSSRQLYCRGNWDLANLTKLKSILQNISWPKEGEIIFNGAAISKMDSAGAWLLNTWQNRLEQKGLRVSLQKFSDEHQTLYTIVGKDLAAEKQPTQIKPLSFLGKIGKSTLAQFKELQDYLAYIGDLAIQAFRLLAEPLHWRWNALVNVIYQAGYLALPIIAVLSFMIGVVITYQMGLQLQNYGANIYIVDLLGLGILREFAPLLTAIMVAGRTGSSFTAQIGMMKLNQEIDALDTMGVTPEEILLLPRIIGLVIALPLLTMWSNIFGVVGGMVMSNNMLDITWNDFLHRFPQVIPLRALIIGLGKAPVFALIIASVGTFQGMRVKGSAESVGQNTTRSVVLSIFFIIVADALFSIIFSELKL